MLSWLLAHYLLTQTKTSLSDAVLSHALTPQLTLPWFTIDHSLTQTDMATLFSLEYVLDVSSKLPWFTNIPLTQTKHCYLISDISSHIKKIQNLFSWLMIHHSISETETVTSFRRCSFSCTMFLMSIETAKIHPRTNINGPVVAMARANLHTRGEKDRKTTRYDKKDLFLSWHHRSSAMNFKAKSCRRVFLRGDPCP